MTLDDAKTQLEALPGVYDVSMFVVRSGSDARPELVQINVHIASPALFPEETRQGILRIQSTLESELGCFVSFAVSAGLRMPDWAAS